MKFVSLVCVLLYASTALADTLGINDFAYGYRLESGTNNTIYTLTLPDHVYQTVTQDSYADLRVFNDSGIAVPHLLRHEKNLPGGEKPDVTIPIFPVNRQDQSNTARSGSPAVSIETNERGAIINIEPENSATGNSTGNNEAYILDLSQFADLPHALSLKWSDSQGDFNETLAVSGSDNLVDWQTLLNDAPLTNLRFAGHQIIKRRIELPPFQYKYLRLQWSGPNRLNIESVTGHIGPIPDNRPRRSTLVQNEYFDEKQRSFYFNSNARYPVDSINVQLSQNNLILEVTVSSSKDSKGPWINRFTGLIYNLNKDGRRIDSPEIPVPNINDRYWRLTATQERQGLKEFSPSLELKWTPHQLVYIAQGTPPFTLAYGNSRLTQMSDNGLAQLLAKQLYNEKLTDAILGKQIVLSGNAATQPLPADSRAYWRSIILWAVLIIGLVILLHMVTRLYRQMNSDNG